MHRNLAHRTNGVLVVLLLTPVVIFLGCKAYENLNGEEGARKFYISSAVIGGLTWILVTIAFLIKATKGGDKQQGATGHVQDSSTERIIAAPPASPGHAEVYYVKGSNGV